MATDKEIEQKLAKKVKYAKHTNINFMTIQQIQDAKKILNAKLSDRNLDGTIRIKLESLSADYEQAERSIDKYYKAVTDNPKTRSLRYGQRNLLTIAQIRNKQSFKKNKDIKYNAVDWMRDVKMDKIALGVGVAAMGVGSYMAIASIKVGEKTLGEIIKQALGQWIKSNPWAFGLLAGGASLIALSKIVPAIDKKHQDIVRHKKDVNAMQNSISEALSADEFQVDSKMLSNADFANSKDFDNFAHALNDNPELRYNYEEAVRNYNDPKYTGIKLSGTQLKNVLKSLKRSIELQKENQQLSNEYDASVEEYNSSLPKETTKETSENVAEEKPEEPTTTVSPRVKDFEDRLSRICTNFDSKELKAIEQRISEDSDLTPEQKAALQANIDAARERIRQSQQKAAATRKANKDKANENANENVNGQ